MFRNLLLAIAVTFAPLSVASADVPGAQQRPPANAEQAFVAWIQPLVNSLDRGGSAVLPLLNVDLNFAEGDEQAARAAIREMARNAVAARQTLSGVRAEIDALSPFAYPGSDAELIEVSEILLRDSRQSLANMDSMLDVIIDFGAAIERNDRAEVERIQPRMENSARVLIRSQATMLRARQRLAPRTSSPFHAIGGMAAMYDGMAALLESDANFNVAEVETAATAMSISLIAERAAIALERAMVRRSDPAYADFSQLMDVRQQISDVNERSRDILRAAAEDARAGRSNDLTRLAHLDVLGRYEYEYQALARRQIEIFGRLSR